MQYDRHTYKTGTLGTEGRWRGDTGRRWPSRSPGGLGTASPWASRRRQPCRHCSPRPQVSRAAREMEALLCRPSPQRCALGAPGRSHSLLGVWTQIRRLQPLVLLSRGRGLPPPGNSSFQPRFVQLTQQELKKQMNVRLCKVWNTPTLLEHSFLRSQTPRPSAGCCSPHIPEGELDVERRMTRTDQECFCRKPCHLMGP